MDYLTRSVNECRSRCRHEDWETSPLTSGHRFDPFASLGHNHLTPQSSRFPPVPLVHDIAPRTSEPGSPPWRNWVTAVVDYLTSRGLVHHRGEVVHHRGEPIPPRRWRTASRSEETTIGDPYTIITQLKTPSTVFCRQHKQH